jgi:threonylcarbamoyladenosine tRNA methylthiotransferase MtaB
MKYSIITFGCRVNQADSVEIEAQLLAAGATPSDAATADVVVVNTCSVTATADQGARQTIRRVARQNPAAQLVVTGCYATRQGHELADLPGVVRVVPNQHKTQVGLAVLSLVSPPTPDSRPLSRASRIPSPESRVPSPESRVLTTADRFGAGDGACGAAIEPGLAGRTAYTLRVQTGCDEPCSYCIIPTTRGTGRSRPLETIVHELDRVAGAGFKEIVITGVHLGSYGRDLPGHVDLFGLLRRFDAHPGDMRFRISSLEPMDCTPEIVDLVGRSGRFAAHFHLPLQHASDRVLAAMRRPYTIGAYAALVDDIRDTLPDAAIGSDVIVGFPGESEHDVDQLLDYLAHSPLTHLHVFPYSDRPGTVAASLPHKVPGALVRDRARRVRQIGSTLTERFRRSQVHTVRPSLTIDDGSMVVTDNYLKVKIAPGRARNEWVDVRVTAYGDPMVGQLINL